MIQFFRYLRWEISVKILHNMRDACVCVCIYIYIYKIYMHAFRYLWHAIFPIQTYIQTHIHVYGYIHKHVYVNGQGMLHDIHTLKKYDG